MDPKLENHKKIKRDLPSAGAVVDESDRAPQKQI
jgi:hypothetical protein